MSYSNPFDRCLVIDTGALLPDCDCDDCDCDDDDDDED